jgi:hypothetical protein
LDLRLPIMVKPRLLAPPYQHDHALAEPPPLGSIAIAVADSARRVAEELEPFLFRAPWCIPCLVISDATAAPDVLAAIHRLPGQPAFIREPPSRTLLPGLALAAARHRAPPTGAMLADYVARRTGCAALRSTLATLLAAAAEEPAASVVPVRTLRDRLRRLGPLTPRCWRTIGTLSRIAATASGSGVDGLAWRAGVCPRSLRSWSRRYLALSLREFRRYAGWEWVLEAALRKAGLVAEPAGSRPTAVTAPTPAAEAPEPAPCHPAADAGRPPAETPLGRPRPRLVRPVRRRRGREPAGASGT